MRIVFMLLIALGAAMYFPSSRAVVLETVAPVLDPVLRWSTRGELRRVVRDLETQGQGGRFPTDQESFRTWMERNFQGDGTEDAWGNPYLLRLASTTFSVVSFGPDGLPDTDDDVVVEGSIEGDIRRRR